MRVYLHEIKEIEKTIDVDGQETWALEALKRVDEASDSDFAPEVPRPPGTAAPKRQRAVRAHMELRRVDSYFVVSGWVDAHLQLYCSRCGKPFELHVHPKFSALYCQDPEMAGLPERAAVQHSVKGHANTLRPSLEDGAGSDQDVDITYLEEDFIDLLDVMTEQMQLQVPFQPLCREDCKGICAQCGTDLNESGCACDKINRNSPFAALKGLGRKN